MSSVANRAIIPCASVRYNRSRNPALRAPDERACDVRVRASLTLSDYWSPRFITVMRLSPDGHAIAFVVQSADRAANETRSAIWLLDLRSGEARQQTSGGKRESRLRSIG